MSRGARSREALPRVARDKLKEMLRDPGFTPAVRELDAVADLLVDDDVGKHAERAMARAGTAGAEKLRARLESAKPPLRGRIVRAMARFAGQEATRAALVEALRDEDGKTRRNAAIALGHTGPNRGAEEALLAAWQADPRVEMRRSIAASLGKMGSEPSLPIVREATASEDAELARIAQKAQAMIERTSRRSSRDSHAARGRIDAARAPAEPIAVMLSTRRGLEDLVVEELSRVSAVSDVRVAAPGDVRATLRGELRALFAARTWASVRFLLDEERVRDAESIEEAVARSVTSDAARAALGAFAAAREGARYRLAWAEGGHKRAATWNAVRAIARREPALVNDPTESTWEFSVGVRHRFVDVAIVPRALDDPRWTWRRGDVPAASHPTIAAALALVAGVRDDDVAWDPFVGSGLELVERALLGPYRSLHGSDLDERALAVARDNLSAARVAATLERADALTHSPAGVTLVVTNPPMGRRAARAPGIAETLDRFVAHAARVLAPAGRLVWIAPWPKRARAAADRAGLRLDWSRAIDMGGFEAEMQKWVRPSS